MAEEDSSEVIKKIRRKIEDNLRKNFTDKKILSLAHLLGIINEDYLDDINDKIKPQEKNKK